LVRGNGGERAQGPQPLPTQAEPELLLDLSDDGLLSGLARLGLAAGEHERSGARLADHEQLPAVRVEQDERGDADVVHTDHTPEAPRRWESSRCVSTIPMASMSGYIVVGPTERNPLLFCAFDRAADCGPAVGIASTVRSGGVSARSYDRTNASRPRSSRSSWPRAAVWTQALAWPRGRTFSASARRRLSAAPP